MNTPRVVTQNAHLTLHYRLAVGAGEAARDLVSTHGQPPATLQLGQGQLSPGIEARLIGMREGERAVLDFAVGEAFGMRNPDLVQRVTRGTYDRDIDPTHAHAVGDLVSVPGPRGGQVRGVLKELSADHAVLDFNHPLAGQPVTFEVSIIGVLE